MNWFTPKKRKAIYATAAGVGAVLVLAGLLAPEVVDHWLKVLGSALDASALILALLHTDTSTDSGMPGDVEAKGYWGGVSQPVTKED